VNASVLDAAASAIVVLTGIYLVALGALCAAQPGAAARFLGAFASTPLLHGVEIAIRIIIGAALVRHAVAMQVPAAFRAAGWILVITSALLALVPWRLHARFAQAAVPRATRHLPLLAAGSLLGGAFVIWAWSGMKR
jgi:hypothetical protein